MLQAIMNLLGVVFAIAALLLPSIIAQAKDHPNKVAIILVNIFGGMLFGIGWLVALIWCFVGDGKATSAAGVQTMADELAKLHALKESGALTQEEFDTQKQAVLSRTGSKRRPLARPRPTPAGSEAPQES